MKFFSIQAAILFFLIAGCSRNLPSPSLTPDIPENAGMSSPRLARVDSMCLQAIRENRIPGAVVLVARHGKIVYHKAFGMADNQAGRELRRDDIFRIASQSKAITATAAMMLWEEGKFRLDDPVAKYIPEFEGIRVLETFHPADSTYTAVPASRPVTIRHLMTHTSGLGYGMIDNDEEFKMIYPGAGITDLFTIRDITIEENIRKLAGLPLHHEPGERFTYSEGLDVLGYLVEIWSGVPFDRFLRTRIFDPLGMDDTWFYLPETHYDRLVTIQMPENGGWVPYPVTFYDPDYPVKGAKTFFSGGAGLCSTPEDYAEFLQMYLNGGEYSGNRILSRTTVDTIMHNHFPEVWDDTTQYYGLAFEVLTEKGAVAGGMGNEGTFSWGGYFNTQYFADPQENVIGIIMKQTQRTVVDNTGSRFRQLVVESIAD